MFYKIYDVIGYVKTLMVESRITSFSHLNDSLITVLRYNITLNIVTKEYQCRLINLAVKMSQVVYNVTTV